MTTTNETKICPLCAEEIKVEAIKCKFCGTDLVEHERKKIQVAQMQAQTIKIQERRKKDWNLLKNILIFIVVFPIALLFIQAIVKGFMEGYNGHSGDQVSTTTTSQIDSKKVENKTSYPYKFVKSKDEQIGKPNVVGSRVDKMDLYAYSGKFNMADLIKFCQEQKKNFSSNAIYYLVIFDNATNATFPSDPFSSAYGIEETPQKHIRAYYEFNNLNGYSVLNYYDKNKWESRPKETDI
jgi:hypothetical protein